MRIAQIEAMRGLVDFGRIRNMLDRVKGNVVHKALPHLSPLSAPLFLEAGRIPVKGRAIERLVANEAAQLMAEAGLKIHA